MKQKPIIPFLSVRGAISCCLCGLGLARLDGIAGQALTAWRFAFPVMLSASPPVWTAKPDWTNVRLVVESL